MRIVITIGMHRSGTSLVARLMNLAGVDLGRPDRLKTPKRSNRKGFWESQPLVDLHDAVLEELGGSWDHPPALFEGWEHASELDRYRDQARSMLEAVFGDGDDDRVIGWKDPRCTLLLPFWRTVAPIDATLLAVRDPAEVTASLNRRFELNRLPQMDPEHAASLCLRYHLAGLRDGPEPLVIRYDDVLADVEGTVERIVDHAGLPGPDEEGWQQIREFADPDQRHHARLDVVPGPMMAAARALYEQPEVTERFAGLLLDGVQASGVVAAVGATPGLAARTLRDLAAERRRRARAAKDQAELERWLRRSGWTVRVRLAGPWRLGAGRAVNDERLQIPPAVARWVRRTRWGRRAWIALPWRFGMLGRAIASRRTTGDTP